MFNIKCLSVKKVFVVAASALALSLSAYATELVSVGKKGGAETIQCIDNAGMRLCCTGVGTEGMSCQLV